MTKKDRELKELQKIPWVGEKTAIRLWNIGIKKVEDLKGKDPEDLYNMNNIRMGNIEDRCLLYVFRCIVYYASHKKYDPKKLLWWNWKDKK